MSYDRTRIPGSGPLRTIKAQLALQHCHLGCDFRALGTNDRLGGMGRTAASRSHNLEFR